MLGKIKNSEIIEANKNFNTEMIKKAGAKSLECGVKPEDIKAGDIILHREHDGWKIKTVSEADIKIEFGFTKVFGKSLPNFQRFVF